MSSTVLTVAIGLILLYVILSLICSGLSEGVASARNRRGAILFTYIGNILGSDAMHFYAHPLIRAIQGPVAGPLGYWSRRLPPTIPPFICTVVLFDFQRYLYARSSGDDELSLEVQGGPDARKAFEQRIHELPRNIRHVVGAFYAQVRGDVDACVRLVTELFAYADTLVESAYRRTVRRYLWFFAFAITVALNIDTVHIANALWTQHANEALRWPIGWAANTRDLGLHFGDITSKVIGWFLTIGAISFGAQFWLGILERIARIPPREEKKKDDDRQG